MNVSDLSEKQKESARWIYGKIKSGELGESFSCVFSISTGKCLRFQGKGDTITEDIPITRGFLRSFKAADLLDLEDTERTVTKCELLGNNLFKAVENDFEDKDIASGKTVIIEKSDLTRTISPKLLLILVLVITVVITLSVFLITNNLLNTILIILVSLIIFMLIGIFFMKLDESLSEKSFVQLVELFFEKIIDIFK